MPTAIVLLLLLAAASMLGTLVPGDDPARTVFHAPWFLTLLAVVGVNLAACSVNRIGVAWRRTWHPEIAVTPDAVRALAAAEGVDTPLAPAAAAAACADVLRHAGYTVHAGDGALHAARGHLSLWGPILTHVSLLVIFLGAAYGSLRGLEGATTINEGETTATYTPRGAQHPVPLGFTLALRAFSITADDAGTPVAYRSAIEVREGDRAVRAQAIDGNHPLTHRGLSLYQSDFGLVGCVVAVTDARGETVRVPLPLTTLTRDREKHYGLVEGKRHHLARFARGNVAMIFTAFAPDTARALPAHPRVALRVNTRYPASRDAWRDLGWLDAGAPRRVDGYTLTLERAVPYTVLTVSRNPGLPVVYAGFALLLLGVVASFYITYKAVRVHIVAGEAGATVIFGGVTKIDPGIFRVEFGRLRDALTRGEARP